MSPARWTPYLLAFAVGPALAADNKQDQAGAAIGLLLLVGVLAASLQVLLAALFPGFVRQVAARVRRQLGPTAGWGVLWVVLALILAVVLGNAGKIGQMLVGLELLVVLLLAAAGGAGLSLVVGEWAISRGGADPAPLPLSVLVGATVCGWAALVPAAGQLALLAAGVVCLGAALQTILAKRQLTTDAGGDAPSESHPQPSEIQ